MPAPFYNIPVEAVDRITQQIVGKFPHLQKPTDRAVTKLRNGALAWDENILGWRCAAENPKLTGYTVDFDTCTCPSFESQDYQVQPPTRTITYCKHKIALRIYRKYMAVSITDVIQDAGSNLILDEHQVPICEVVKDSQGWQPATPWDLKLWLDDHFGIGTEPEFDLSALYLNLLDTGHEQQEASDIVDSYLMDVRQKEQVM
jgi:hypothetical protein